jgi:hypothetical protein
MSSKTSKNIVKTSKHNEPKISIIMDGNTKELDELEKLDKLVLEPKTFYKSKLIEETNDLYDELENASSVSLKPKNYGNKWTDDDKKQLLDFLKKGKNQEINYSEIADKLGRSEGGIKGEIKKMIMTRYLNGAEADIIATELNIQYKFVKIIIKTYIDNEIVNDINNLEKENKFLKLKMENIELRKMIAKLNYKK